MVLLLILSDNQSVVVPAKPWIALINQEGYEAAISLTKKFLAYKVHYPKALLMLSDGNLYDYWHAGNKIVLCSVLTPNDLKNCVKLFTMPIPTAKNESSCSITSSPSPPSPPSSTSPPLVLVEISGKVVSISPELYNLPKKEFNKLVCLLECLFLKESGKKREVINVGGKVYVFDMFEGIISPCIPIHNLTSDAANDLQPS